MSESSIRAFTEEADGATALHNSRTFYHLCIPELAFVGHLLSAQLCSYLILPTTHHVVLISLCVVKKLGYEEMEEQGQSHPVHR